MISIYPASQLGSTSDPTSVSGDPVKSYNFNITFDDILSSGFPAISVPLNISITDNLTGKITTYSTTNCTETTSDGIVTALTIPSAAIYSTVSRDNQAICDSFYQDEYTTQITDTVNGITISLVAGNSLGIPTGFSNRAYAYDHDLCMRSPFYANTEPNPSTTGPHTRGI